MKNYVQPGRTVTVPAPAGGAVSGDPVLVGSIFGVACGSAPEGAPLEIDTEGVFDLPKTAGQAFGVGDKAYFDPAAKAITAAAGGNKLVGSALLGAAGADATAQVKLPGMVIG